MNEITTKTSGIQGIVMLGPIAPVAREGEINEKPYADALIYVMNAGGTKKITEFKSDTNGRFKINLFSGTYQLIPQTPQNNMFPVGEPQTIVVQENKFTDVTIRYDTGIR